MKQIIQWLIKPFRHVHDYKLVQDTAMDNNTNHLIFRCKCGELELKHVHRESEVYKSLKRK